jgi:hypothetical protein
MNDGERRRYFAGRHDWREHRWEDHCGEPGCEESGCRDNYIPEGNARLAEDRCRFAESILGAEIERPVGFASSQAAVVDESPGRGPDLHRGGADAARVNPRSVGSRS